MGKGIDKNENKTLNESVNDKLNASFEKMVLDRLDALEVRVIDLESQSHVHSGKGE